MKRRKFIQSTIAASTLPISYVSAGQVIGPAKEKGLIEVRTYEMKFRGNQGLLRNYLNNTYKPALEKVGVSQFLMLTELGNSDPAKLWVFINYPDAKSYIAAQNLPNEKSFQKAAADYDAITPDKTIYSRYTSSLLLGFDGMPQMEAPASDSSIFELRTYEGFSEDAVRRKIKMFNVEEIDLFLKLKMNPVFFGDMIAGPYRPSLVYMLHFKDMATRDSAWKDFIVHPEWKKMSSKKEYTNTVSHIHKVFLKPA